MNPEKQFNRQMSPGDAKKRKSFTLAESLGFRLRVYASIRFC
jgi:hypothetical protein